MPQKILPDDDNFCRFCEKRMERKRMGSSGTLESRSIFRRRKYCDQKCMASALTGRIRVLSINNSRRQSAKARRECCEQCGSVKLLHVHHMDENPLNNTPSNLKTLCLRCHFKWHWTHGKMSVRQRKPCLLCDRPSRSHGYCWKHLHRVRRHGDPLVVKRGNQNGTYTVIEDLDGILRKQSTKKLNT